MLARIAAKIKLFFSRKKTQLQVIKYTAPKQPNQALEFLLVNILFITINTILFPEFTILESIIMSLIITTSLNKQARHFVRHSPELMTG